MSSVPASLVDIVRDEISDKKISPARIRESILRVGGGTSTPSIARTFTVELSSDTSQQDDGGMTCLDAAVKVLAESGVAMKCGEMMNAMIAARYWKPARGGKTPAATLSTMILREGRGSNSRIEKVGRGKFALTSYGKKSVL